jgi:hypothetical protein
MPLSPSGRTWVARFPGSTSIADLEPGFQQCVRRFLDAVASARSGLPNANAPVMIANANGRPAVLNGMGRAPGQAARVAVAPGAQVARVAVAPRAQVANAHPRVQIRATFRPAQRAYMMHYSWLINQNQIDPRNVPRYEPPDPQRDDQKAQVDIDWVHRDPKGNYNSAASKQAALEMVNGFSIAGLRVAPALNSNHVRKRAIDMSISWNGNLEIADANGHTVRIDTGPRDGTNRRLISVGATYGVYHLGLINGVLNERTVNRDPPHWSDNGR